MQAKSDVESRNEFRKALDEQQKSAGLATTETRALAVANLEGDEATRRAAVSNAILALTYNKTADQLRALAPEIAKLREALTVNRTPTSSTVRIGRSLRSARRSPAAVVSFPRF